MAKKKAKNPAADAGNMAHVEKTVQDYAEEFQRLAESQAPVYRGFSARLNMLWDLALSLIHI